MNPDEYIDLNSFDCGGHEHAVVINKTREAGYLFRSYDASTGRRHPLDFYLTSFDIEDGLLLGYSALSGHGALCVILHVPTTLIMMEPEEGW